LGRVVRIGRPLGGILHHQPVAYRKAEKLDNAMLGCENAVEFYRTSAVEYLLD